MMLHYDCSFLAYSLLCSLNSFSNISQVKLHGWWDEWQHWWKIICWANSVPTPSRGFPYGELQSSYFYNSIYKNTLVTSSPVRKKIAFPLTNSSSEFVLFHETEFSNIRIWKCIFDKILSCLFFSLKLDTWEWCIDPWIKLSYLG